MDRVVVEGSVVWTLSTEGGAVEVEAGRVAEVRVELLGDLRGGVYRVEVCSREGVSAMIPSLYYAGLDLVDSRLGSYQRLRP